MEKITHAKLEQYLRQKSHRELMGEILDLFTRFDVVREDYQQRLGVDTRVQVMPDIPTYDYLEHRNPDDYYTLDWIIKDIIQDIEKGYFLQWEAVIRQEQGLRLTAKHKKILRGLLNFGDDDDQILYIDGLERPSQSWYEIVRIVVPKLVPEKFVTSEIYTGAVGEGWHDLVQCLRKYGRGLSLPKGVKSPVDVIPPEIQHRLWLQYCFDALGGLGQDESLTLEDEGQRGYRINWFVDRLKEHKESVAFFGLTLESMLELVILPPRDREIFIELMLKELKLASVEEPLVKKLGTQKEAKSRKKKRK